MGRYYIDELYVGQYYEKRFSILESAGNIFAQISNDFNPIHLDAQTASKTRFKKKIVHGMLIVSYFSGIIGTEFPGEGSIYVSQDVSFKKPVLYNVDIKIRVEIATIEASKNCLTLKTQCIGPSNEILVDGNAKILFENKRENEDG